MRRIFDQRFGSGIDQLRRAAITPQDSQALNIVCARTDHIVHPIANHDRLVGCDFVAAEYVLDELALVAPCSIELTPVDAVEPFAKAKVLHDSLSKQGWLGGTD